MFQELATRLKRLFSTKPTTAPTSEPEPVVEPQASPISPSKKGKAHQSQRSLDRKKRKTEAAGKTISGNQSEKQSDRVYFGSDNWPSEKIYKAQYDPKKTGRWNLPKLDSEKAVAEWLDISLSRLRWFTHDQYLETTWHYTQFTIPKRSGGQRTIIAPKRELKAIQRKILHDLLALIPLSAQAHGFTPNRSILTNAHPHIDQPILMNLDLKDFFPSITYRRVRGLFISFGYSFAVASTLALLCTEYERDTRSHQGQYRATGSRHLVQGAPTSPALSNLITRDLDNRLYWLARWQKFNYTRYADDLTFSGPNKGKALHIFAIAQQIIREEGFQINPQKTRFYPKATRQMVTGIVVNQQLSTPRQLRRHLRAILKNARRTGLEGQNRSGHKNYHAYVRGLIEHVRAVNPTQGEKLLEEFNRLL